MINDQRNPTSIPTPKPGQYHNWRRVIPANTIPKPARRRLRQRDDSGQSAKQIPIRGKGDRKVRCRPRPRGPSRAARSSMEASSVTSHCSSAARQLACHHPGAAWPRLRHQGALRSTVPAPHRRLAFFTVSRTGTSQQDPPSPVDSILSISPGNHSCLEQWPSRVVHQHHATIASDLGARAFQTTVNAGWRVAPPQQMRIEDRVLIHSEGHRPTWRQRRACGNEWHSAGSWDCEASTLHCNMDLPSVLHELLGRFPAPIRLPIPPAGITTDISIIRGSGVKS